MGSTLRDERFPPIIQQKEEQQDFYREASSFVPG
jgi:hypothetical protein